MSSNKHQLISIQYLRAIAALMVVLHHTINSKSYSAFASGVDIFFVISGFIMYVAARNENYVDFLGRRVIRVAPLYWIATFSLFAIETKFHIWLVELDNLNHIVQSLLFIPHYSPNRPDQIWPYLVPGWTLNYEMLFYFIFFIGLLFKRPLLVSTIAICSLFSIGVFLNPEAAALKAYTRPFVLEFLCGAWIAWAYTKGVLNRFFPLVIIFGFVILFSLPLIDAGQFTLAIQILSCSMIVTGALLLGNRIRYFKLLHLLGDASYSIYLTHTFISLSVSRQIWQQVPIEGWIQLVVRIMLALVVSSIVGVIVHSYIEKPVLRWLRSKWEVFLSKRRANNMSSEIAKSG